MAMVYVPQEDAEQVRDLLRASGENVRKVGRMLDIRPEVLTRILAGVKVQSGSASLLHSALQRRQREEASAATPEKADRLAAVAV